MSNKFLRALAAVKLVELDEAEQKKLDQDPDQGIDMAEIDRMVAAELAKDEGKAKAAAPRPAPAVHAAAAPSGAGPAPGAATSGVLEGQPFDAFYAGEGVQTSPFTAEKLLKLLDGLRAMPPETRKQAVLAMDAADEEWSIADAVLDSQRKIRALTNAGNSFKAQLGTIQEHVAAEKKKRDDYLAQATETVRQKIADLERTLQEETITITSQKAELDARAQNAQAAVQRELARLDTEIQRLREIPSTFAVQRTE